MLEGWIKEKKIQLDERGKIVDGHKYTVYEGTSGNTGISLGLLAAYYGMSASIYLNLNLSESKVNSSHQVQFFDGKWLQTK